MEVASRPNESVFSTMDVPFLTSGAMSRAHYALIRRVETATSPSAVDQTVLAEIEAIRARFARGVSNMVRLSRSVSEQRLTPVAQKQTKEYLVLLLYCSMTLQDAEDVNLDFALAHALNLAEAGETVQNKRIGSVPCRVAHRPVCSFSVHRLSVLCRDDANRP